MNTQNSNRQKVLISALVLLMMPCVALAQEKEVVTTSYFSNALFNALLITIVLLAVLIMGLSSVLKNFSNSDLLLKILKEKDQDKKNNSANTTTLLIFFMIAAVPAFSQ